MQPDNGPPLNTFPTDWLSAYLDGELVEPERRMVESALQQDASLAGTLNDLVLARNMIRSLAEQTATQRQSTLGHSLPWASIVNSKLLTDVPSRWNGLDDGLETDESPPPLPARHLSSSAFRSRRRLLGALAASFLGMVALGASFWVIKASVTNLQLSRLESPPSNSGDGTLDCVVSAQDMSMPAVRSESVPMAARSVESSIAMESALTIGNEPLSTEVTEYAPPNLNLALSSPELVNSDDGGDLLDRLIQEGIHRSVESDLLISTTSASHLQREGIGLLGREMKGETLEKSPRSTNQTATFGTQSSLALIPASVRWYRTEYWSEMEVLQQQTAHPMLQTLRISDETNRPGKPTEQRRDPMGLAPLAVIQISAAQTPLANQSFEEWLLLPRWRLPDESIRVLFISTIQLHQLLDALGRSGDAEVFWIRSSQNTQETDKCILVVHFLGI